MTRKVYDNDMVAHVWAQQEQGEARSHNGNFHFSGAAIYSYRTPIGRFVETAGGEKVALVTSRSYSVTSRSYSVTTSGKHMPAVYRALGYGSHAFSVPSLGDYYGDRIDHAGNLAHLAAQYDEAANRFKRAREIYRNEESIADWLYGLDEKAARYAALFGLEYETREVQADAAAIMAHRAAREAKANTPAAIAKREKAAAARDAKKAREAELLHATAIERLAAWRAGELARLDRYSDLKTDATGGAFLRVRGANLETSQGATVPLAHAVRVFRFVKLCREAGEGWRRNGRTLRVGHFQVDSVDAEGNFRAGCHRINWPEVETAAKAAGVIDEAAADTRD